MRRLALVALAGLVAIACGASTTQTQDLRLAYHKGDTYKYAIHSTANETIDLGTIGTFPINIDMKANETVTVKSVDSAGTADLSIEMTNLSMTTSLGGSNTSTAPSQIITMQVGVDGRILSVNGNAISSNPFTMFSGVGGGFISAVLPDKSVQPGDKWSKTYDQANPQGSGSIHISADSKYIKDDGKLAVVETTSNSTIDMSIDMTKLAAGSTVSSIPGLTTGFSIQSISFKGTVNSVITTSIDTSTHRVAKTHRTSKVDATMTMNFAGGNTQGIPGLTGPFKIKGDETTDLTPA